MGEKDKTFSKLDKITILAPERAFYGPVFLGYRGYQNSAT